MTGPRPRRRGGEVHLHNDAAEAVVIDDDGVEQVPLAWRQTADGGWFLIRAEPEQLSHQREDDHE